MGGKNKPDNSQVVNEQKAEAAQAAAKEAARQARLTQGLASIKQAFEGAPVMANTTSNYDWSSFKAPEAMPAAMSQWLAQNPGTAAPDFSKTGSVPAGYTAVQAIKPATGAAGQGGVRRMFNGVDLGPATAGRGPAGQGQPTWALKDASGALHYQGDPFNVDTQVQTGTTGGFDDAFYNKYKQNVLDYYMPQVDKQYKDAKDELTYRLGRSGNLRSSAANTAVADLASQNDINQAGVRNQADTAEGDLRTQVSSERAKATSQLYATEDPEVAANQALSSVRDISLAQPNLSPLSALFNVATVGGANILKGYQGQQALNTFNNALAKTPAQRIVGGG